MIEECAVLVGLDVVSGLSSVVSETTEWSRPSPIVMEQCQEALSCVYYLLQRFPSKFITGLDGVSFCAALQACLGPEELGLAIMEDFVS